MANTFLDLPTTAANGPGTAVDVSTMGALKTVTVAKNAAVVQLQPSVTIEVACDAAGAVWTPLKTFQGGGQQTFQVACLWMRASVSNYRGGGAPNCDVGSDDTGATAANLPVTAGNGIGAPVDVSALPNFKTIQIGGAFRGAVNVDISEDGNDYTTIASTTVGKIVSLPLAAEWMRVVRVGVPQVAPGLPIVNVAATDFGGGGGVSGIELEDDGAPVAGGPFTTLDFIGDGVSVADGGGGTGDITVPGNVTALPEQWVVEDVGADAADEPMSAQVSTNFDDILAIRDGSIVGLRVRLTEAITSGEMEVAVTINGVPTALVVTMDAVTNSEGGAEVAAVGDIPYNDGDAIGVVYTTDAAFEPIATIAAECWVEVFEVP